MATGRLDVLAVGELNPDLILSGTQVLGPAIGTEQEFDTGRLVLGSATALCAVALARLGLRTALVARVGDDDYGRFCTTRLREEGVDTSGLVVDPAVATGLTVAVSYPADRLLLTVPGTMRRLVAEDVPAGLLDAARHLHVSSFFLQHALQPGLPALLDAALARGLTTSLDTGWDPSEIWMTPLLREVLARIDVLLPNEGEVMALGAETDVGRAATSLLALGPRRVVVKMGARGATTLTSTTSVSAPGCRVARVVDTTGAGDNFNGGYLFGTLSGWPSEHCLALGNACGALSVGVVGGVGGYRGLAEPMALAGVPVIAPR